MTSDNDVPTDTSLVDPNNSPDQSNTTNRRAILRKTGMLLGAASALAALGTPADAADKDDDASAIVGLWAVNISSPDGSFPSFPAFETWGPGNPGIWIGSGQPDLTPAALSSTGWGIWRKVGSRKYRIIARFWTYDPSANPTGFATIDFSFTLSKDGNSYHGEGAIQYYDTNGNPLGSPSATLDDGRRIA